MRQKKPQQKKKSDYHVIGYVFLAIALGMLIFETTRGLAIAFFAIGIAFVVIDQDEMSTKKKSGKKKSN